MRVLAYGPLLAAALVALRLAGGSVPQGGAPDSPRRQIPKVWDDELMAGLEVPLAVPSASPKHVPADFYYRIPVRPIYKSYHVYHPSQEPPGYLDMLRAQEPLVLWDDKGRSPTLRTDQDWIRAGELVFDSAVLVGDGRLAPNASPSLFVREVDWYRHTGAPVTRDGVLPFYRYVVREKGKIELGVLSCGMCHTRVMPGGAVVKGAQGNFPFDRAYAWDVRESGSLLDGARELERALFGAPWLTPDPQARLREQSGEEIAAAHDAIPPGVLARHRTSTSSPVQVPDLIGVRDRRYLDRTGLQRHNGIADLMRYAALNQGGDNLSSYAGFIPAGREFKTLLEPASYERYSDEQLHALALYIYSLRPPPNPNKRSLLTARGERIFNDRDNRCATCHKPPLYTNNELTIASDFEVRSDHPDFDLIMKRSVDTDPTLTLRTRRGTGLYKVPSLLGVWYRGPFEHSGSVLTLEDWFDARRTRGEYVPTGWKGPPGTTRRAVNGHDFGLDLSAEEKKALIAFLKTL
jgi:hypothetical protein